MKKQFTYDGVKGMLLPASFGSPSALCTKIYEETLDGLGLRKTLLNAKRLKNPMELDDVYERMKKNNQLRLGRPTDAFEAFDGEDAPQIHALSKKADQEDDPVKAANLLDHLWGGSFVRGAEKPSIAGGWDMTSTEEENEDEEAAYGDVEEVKAEKGVPKTIANADALCDELQITMETSLRTRDALGALTDAKLDWFSKKLGAFNKECKKKEAKSASSRKPADSEDSRCTSVV